MELRLPLEMSPGREAACRAVFGTVESSWTRDQTCVPCIGRGILKHCTTREVPIQYLEGRAQRILDALDVGCEGKREVEDEMLDKHLHSL